MCSKYTKKNSHHNAQKRTQCTQNGTHKIVVFFYFFNPKKWTQRYKKVHKMYIELLSCIQGIKFSLKLFFISLLGV